MSNSRAYIAVVASVLVWASIVAPALAASSFTPGATCYAFIDSLNTVTGTYDTNGNCVTASGSGGTTAVTGAQVLNGSGQFTTPTPTPTTPANSSTGGSAGASVPNGVANYAPLEPFTPFSDPGSKRYANLSSYLNTLYKILVTVGALAAVTMLVIGGAHYIVSDSLNDKDWARKRITAALWGLLILIGSFLILYTINPNLLVFNLKMEPLQVCNSGNPNCNNFKAVTTGPNVCNGQTVCVTQNGNVGQIQTNDGDAAIVRMQNTPSTARTPEIQQAASENLHIDEAKCTGDPSSGGFKGTIGKGNNACLADQPGPFYYGSDTFTACANINTPSGTPESCYYNK